MESGSRNHQLMVPNAHELDSKPSGVSPGILTSERLFDKI